MATLQQNFEGMTDAAIPSGVHGNNQAPDAIQLTAGATCEAHSGSAYSGTRGMRCRIGTTTGGAAWIWSTQRALITESFSRWYFKPDALPGLTIGIQRYYTAALASMGGINYSGGTGKFALVTPAGTTDTISVVDCDPGNWCRLEARHFADTVNGMMTLRIFLEPSAAIDDFDEEINYGSVKVMATNQSKRIDYGVYGSANNGPSAVTSEYMHFDGIMDSGTDWWGAEEQVLRPDSDVSVGAGWTTAPLFDALDDDSDATLITGVAS